MRASTLALSLALPFGAAACSHTARVTRAPDPLPPLASDQVLPPSPAPVTVSPLRVDTAARPEPRVSLTASNASVRELLPALAEAAGLSIVIGPDVQGRVSVHFESVPVSQAIAAVLEEAGLSVRSDAPMREPWGPTVFYPLAVDIDRLDAAQIQSRFDTSTMLAQWIVEARKMRLEPEKR